MDGGRPVLCAVRLSDHIHTAQTKGTPNYFLNFYARRALRILPAYYGCLIVTFFFFWLAPGARRVFPDLYRLKAWYWVYMQNWLVASFQKSAPNLGFLTHFWSLAVEEQFYLAWPLLVYLLNPRRLARACTFLIVASLFARVSLSIFNQSTPAQQFMYFSTATRIDCLSLGALGACLIHRGVAERLLRSISRLTVPVALLCLAIIIALDPHDSMWGNTPMVAVGLSATGVVFLGVLLHVVITPSKLLRRKPLRLMGRYSYGLYLYHVPVIFATNWILIRFGITGVSYALWFGSIVPLLTVGLALSSWHCFERRFLSLKDRFS